MNNYHIYEEIGRGESTVTYKGRKKKTIEYIAVKSLEKTKKKKVKICSSLMHSNILKFYNWYETRNHLWMIVDFCPGGNLMKIIEKDKTIKEDQIRILARDMINGMQYLHSNGIIHGDLKPSNMLLNEYTEIRICDFGLSQKIVDLIHSEQEDNRKGTPTYMAPELFMNDGVKSFSSDLWSLGVIIYEMGTSRPPFESNSFSELVKLIMNQQISYQDSLSSDLNDLLKQLLQKDPIQRITINNIRGHRFFQKVEIENHQIPVQPHFEEYILKNQKQETNKVVEQKKGKDEVNVLRMSMNILKNQNREQNDYQGIEQKKDDFVLNNKDQVLNMGEDQDEEDRISDNQITEQYFSNQHEEQENENINKNNQISSNSNNSNFNIKKPNQQQQTRNLSQIQKNKTLQQNIQNQKKKQQKQQQVEPEQDYDSQNVTPKQIVHQINKNDQENDQLDQIRSKLIDLTQLMIHPHEQAVKPLIGNKEIEKTQEILFQQQKLPFKPISGQEIANKLEESYIENHFSQIYEGLLSNSDKYQILSYLETRIQDSRVSNILLDSVFMKIFIQLIKDPKHNYMVRFRICSIIGSLMRHATSVDNEIYQLNLPAVLSDVIKIEKNEKVKRKAMGALGEYLFYAATQMEEVNSQSQLSNWEISQQSLQCLLKVLKNNSEDDVVKLYAIKTIENITAQSQITSRHFINMDFIQVLAFLFSNSRNEGIKSSSIIILANISRINDEFSFKIIEQLTQRVIIQNLKDENNNYRILLALFSVINFSLIQQPQQTITFFNINSIFFNIMLQISDKNPQQSVKGKVLLTIFILLNIDRNKFIVSINQENRFVHILEKLFKDQNKYTISCLNHVLVFLADNFISFIEIIENEIIELQNQPNNQLDYNRNNIRTKHILKGRLNLLQFIFEITKSQYLQQLFIDHKFIQKIFTLNEKALQITNNKSKDDVLSLIVMICEAFTENQKILFQNSDLLFDNVFPNLLQQLKSQNDDLKFNNLKMFSDIYVQFLSEGYLDDKNKNASLMHIKFFNFTQNVVIPCLVSILEDKDPLPVYSIKLMTLMSESSQIVIQVLSQKDLFQNVLQIYDINNPKFNRSIIKFLNKYFLSNYVKLDIIINLNFIQKSMNILIKIMKSKQEWILEELSELVINYSNQLFILLTDNQSNMDNIKKDLNSIKHIKFVNIDNHKIQLLQDYFHIKELLELLLIHSQDHKQLRETLFSLVINFQLLLQKNIVNQKYFNFIAFLNRLLKYKSSSHNYLLLYILYNQMHIQDNLMNQIDQENVGLVKQICESQMKVNPLQAQTVFQQI